MPRILDLALNRLDKPARSVDRWLCREHFATFQDHCQAHFQISRAHGHRLIAHATATVEMSSLSPNGRHFLKAEGRCDWAVGIPPFSQFRAFLQKAVQVADNVVLLGLAPAWFVRTR